MHLKGTEPHKRLELCRCLFFILTSIFFSLLLILGIQQPMLNDKVMHFIPFLQPLIVLHDHPVLDLSLFRQIVIPKLKVSDIFLCVLVIIRLELLSQTVVSLDPVRRDSLIEHSCDRRLMRKVVNLFKRIIHRILPHVSSQTDNRHLAGYN